MFRGHLDCSQKPFVGGRPTTKLGDHGTLNVQTIILDCACSHQYLNPLALWVAPSKESTDVLKLYGTSHAHKFNNNAHCTLKSRSLMIPNSFAFSRLPIFWATCFSIANMYLAFSNAFLALKAPALKHNSTSLAFANSNLPTIFP